MEKESFERMYLEMAPGLYRLAQITQAPYHTNSPSALEEQRQMQSISQRIDALANEFPSRDLIVSTWKDQGAAPSVTGAAA